MSKGLFKEENNNAENTTNSLLALWGRNSVCSIEKTAGNINIAAGTLGIYILNDVVFSSVTGTSGGSLSNPAALAGLTLPAGLFIPCDCTQFILTSGAFYVFTKTQI